MYRAKQFLDEKQEEHRMTFGVYADVNSKIAEWMQEYTNQRVIEELDSIPHLDTPLGEELKDLVEYIIHRAEFHAGSNEDEKLANSTETKEMIEQYTTQRVIEELKKLENK